MSRKKAGGETGDAPQGEINSTIKDVARLAGVSIKTVSRVVNNEPNVTEAMRKKVQDAIRRCDYVPNRSARGLAGRKSFLIGLFYERQNSSYITRIQAGVLAYCRNQGYELLIHPFGSGNESVLPEIEKVVQRSNLDGVILTPFFSEWTQLLDFLDGIKLPYARVTAVLDDHRSPFVSCDDFDAAFRMTKYLIDLGHKRIGFIKGHPRHNSAAHRHAGYVAALKAANLVASPDLVAQGDYSFTSGEAASRLLLDKAPDVTAIFASNDDMAAGVLRVAHQRKLAVPDDLSVVGFDDADIARKLCPGLTTIRQPVRDLAARASALLISSLRGEAQDQQPQQLLPLEIIIRDSASRAK
ncbi:MAG TPA: LacI family DNA-binding transcriptional regulator [Parvibaculum sp.]|jgi:LacI family transcriptional regulator